MAKWKLFSKSKEEDTAQPEEKTINTSEKTEEMQDKPIAEYHETLDTRTQTKSKTRTVKASSPSEQRVWRDVDAIEENIDTLHIRKAERPITDVDKKVDKLIEKRKRK